MSLKTSNYGAARSILGFSELMLWCGVGLGVIVAIVSAGAAARGFGASGLLAAVPGIFISVICFLGVVLVQMAKATVDTADYSYQMLGVARDQLAVSKQGLSKTSAPVTYNQRSQTEELSLSVEPAKHAFSGQNIATESPETREVTNPIFEGETWEHSGHTIGRTEYGFSVDRQTFMTLELAQKHLDKKAEHNRLESQE